MELADVFLGLGQDSFVQLVRGISIGKLKTYQLYDRVKTRMHLAKLNAESLQRTAPKLWSRIETRDDDFARDIAQAVLVSHLDMIVAVLDSLGIPHEDGFFAKDLDARQYFQEGWSAAVLEKFKGVYPEPLLKFYTGHLAWELKVAG